jgi:metal-sulfur cluster biosynthetic enzyme
MVDEKSVIEALKTCYDPEIPVNIYDLGLVYGIEIKGGTVKVTMTLTAPGCPMHSVITRDVKSKLESMEGVEKAEVELVWEPRWTVDKISPEGKKILGLEG